MKLHLQKIRVGYAEIRGGIKRRGEEIEKFHKDPNCLIFLGSLHAAGLGIDLMPAALSFTMIVGGMQ